MISRPWVTWASLKGNSPCLHYDENSGWVIMKQQEPLLVSLSIYRLHSSKAACRDLLAFLIVGLQPPAICKKHVSGLSQQRKEQSLLCPMLSLSSLELSSSLFSIHLQIPILSPPDWFSSWLGVLVKTLYGSSKFIPVLLSPARGTEALDDFDSTPWESQPAVTSPQPWRGLPI